MSVTRFFVRNEFTVILSGPQGSQGEVSQAALDSAIQGTSPNTNGIGTLDTSYPDPYLEEIRAKLNEVIINGRRWV